MKSYDEILAKFLELESKSKALREDCVQVDLDLYADEIISSAKVFLEKLNIVFERLNSKNSSILLFKNGRYYVKNEDRSLDYDYKNALDISKEAVKTINETLKELMVSASSKMLVRLGVALNTFYAIIDNIKSLEEKEVEKAKKLAASQAEKNKGTDDKLNAEYQKLNEDIVLYFNNIPTDIRECNLDDAFDKIKNQDKFSHTINIGKIVEKSTSKEFIKYVSNLGFEVDEGVELNLEAKDGKNVVLINSNEKYLKRNVEFEDRLKDLILRSFINFESKSYQVAFVEGEDGEVMLAPIVDFIKEASSDYIFNGDVADNEEETIRLIKALNDEVRNRIRTFKTVRKSVCRTIGDYNNLNPDNPLRYIFLVIKDYPSGFTNPDIKEKLENIIIDGANVGVLALIIGENKELTVGYNTKVSPLQIPEEYTIYALDKNELKIKGNDFILKEANYNFDDIELMRKRLKSASSFVLNNLLEDKPELPHYEVVSIPLGKIGSEVYSLRASTEKPPYPFVLVTGGTGCGKSAFMHEIILSGAYKYSPDELEFHVIDFKSADKATEFADYQYGKKMYIPHIKYLSLKSRPENALDIINYIQKLKSKRNRMGKFKSYNESNPSKKMPLIYVIIDEYESMLAGGETAGNSYESTMLQGAIQDGITKIIKTARAFGIGIIFSGQATKGLPQDAFAQISTKIAFKNDENIINKIFPGLNLDLSVFPKDDYRGLAYVSSNGEIPKFAKFAWAGDPNKMAKFCETIRNKYPEHTKAHIQSIIGGTSSAELRLDSFLPWNEEIEGRLIDAEGDYDSKEQFLSSRQDKIIKNYRPLAIGQSSSSEATIYIDYQKDENGHNFFAFGRNENLCPIERNVLLSFLYQIADKNYKDKHIIFMDGSRFGVKEELFGKLIDTYPFINKQIEYISDKTEIARKLLVLAKHMKENKEDNPYLIIMHELDWLDSKEFLPKPKAKKETVADKEQNDKAKNDLSNLAASGIKVPSFLMGANFAAAATKEEQKVEEFETFTALEVKEAFKQLYLNGMLFEHFLFASSIKFENINNQIISLVNDSKGQEQMRNYAIYGSYEMLTTQSVGTSLNANICYVLNGLNSRSTTRLFDYEADESKDWWARLEKMMYIWRD